jgi:hypothetical protein
MVVGEKPPPPTLSAKDNCIDPLPARKHGGVRMTDESKFEIRVQLTTDPPWRDPNKELVTQTSGLEFPFSVVGFLVSAF